MKLQVSKRETDKKSVCKKLRREGKIPANIYSSGKEGETVSIDGNAFTKHVNAIQKGHLPTTVFTLVDENGKERKAIVKEIQYHVTTYDVMHLDFEELHDDVRVNVKVPIQCTGVADCVGVKLGGVVRQVIRYIKVNCLSKAIPDSFKLKITSLSMGDSLRLSDIVFPEDVTPLADLNEVAVVIVKR